jgi:hypothetical protein
MGYVPTGQARLLWRLTCAPVEVDGLPVRTEQSFRVELDAFGPGEMQKAIADAERLTALLREHPEEMTEIVNDALTGRVEVAAQNARKIGLTEEAFQASGGGVFWFAIAIAAGFIVTAATLSGGTPHPHPPPSGPPPDAGPPTPVDPVTLEPPS